MAANKHYTTQEKDFFKSLSSDYTMKEMIDLFYEKFGNFRSREAIRGLIFSLKIDFKKTSFKYKEEHIEYLKELRAKYELLIVAEKFNKKFGANISASALGSFCKKHGIFAGKPGKFQKGHIPHTKNRSPKDWMSEEGYKNFQKSIFHYGIHRRHFPVGHERLGMDGYIWIKIEEPRKWMQKHRYIYEQHYGITLKKGEKVIFLDGNKNNFNINNLQIVSNQEMFFINTNNLYSSNPEITKTGILCHKLITITKEMQNERK